MEEATRENDERDGTGRHAYRNNRFAYGLWLDHEAITKGYESNRSKTDTSLSDHDHTPA